MARFLIWRQSDALEAALSGARVPAASHAALVGLARELREEGLALPMPATSLDRREALRNAVLAARATANEHGPLARTRGAVLGVAAVAGAGLLVASAATGSNPAVLVVDVAREVPRLAPRSGPPASISIEGEVIATRDGGRTLEVRSGSDTIVVEAPKQTRDVTSGGTPISTGNISAGNTVRVTTEREPAAGVVPASKIEVIPAAVTDSLPAATAVANAPAVGKSPDSSGALAGTAATGTPPPEPTRTPTKTVTPKANTTSVSVMPPLDPFETPVPTVVATATPEPKRTPKPNSGQADTNEADTANNTPTTNSPTTD